MKKLLVGCVSLVFTLGLSTGFAAKDGDAKAKDKKKPDAAAAFAKKDKDGDGSVSWDEFKGKREGDAADKLKKTFDKKDGDGNGSLSQAEFTAKRGKKKPAADGDKPKKKKKDAAK